MDPTAATTRTASLMKRSSDRNASSTATAAAKTFEPVQFKTTVTFEDVGGGSNRKTRITMRGDFPSAAERDRVIKEYGADKGLVQTLARLEQHVSSTLNRDREDQSHSARGEKRA